MEWPSLKRPIQAPKQLLVEGRTAEIFFREWVEALGLEGQVEVRDFGSLTVLTDFLKVFTGYKEFRESVVSVGIIRDAEDMPAESAFRFVCYSLQVVGLTCPGGLRRFQRWRTTNRNFRAPGLSAARNAGNTLLGES